MSLINEFDQKWPRHPARCVGTRVQSQALRQLQAEPIEQGRLVRIGPHHTAEPQLPPVGRREDDIRALGLTPTPLEKALAGYAEAAAERRA